MKRNDLYKVSQEANRNLARAKKYFDNRLNDGVRANDPEIDLLASIIHIAENQAHVADLLFLDTAQPETKKAVLTIWQKLSSREYLNQSVDALKNGRMAIRENPDLQLIRDVMTETGGSPAGAEGGFLAPVYFDALVHEKARQYLNLADYVDISEVTSFNGFQTVEKAGPEDGLPEIVEGEEIQDDESIEFVRTNFQLKKYASILPVSNSLFENSPVQIMDYLASWFSKKLVLRYNALIQAELNELTPTETDANNLLSGIKTVLNKTLDPFISSNAAIFTNQTGFDMLDQLVDSQGRPMLQPNPTGETPLNLLNRPIVMLANSQWPNYTEGGNFAPVVVGNLHEYLTLFRPEFFKLDSTTKSKNAWYGALTDVRVIARADVKIKDDQAAVLLKVKY